MTALSPTRAGRTAPYRGTTLLILLFVLGAVLLVLAGSVAETLTTQIVYGSLSLFMLGLAAALFLAKGQGLRRSLASGQLGPYFGLSTATIFGVTSLIWVGPTPTDETALISRVSIISAMVVVGVALGSFVLGYRVGEGKPGRGAASWLRRVVVTDRPTRFGQGSAWLLLGVALLSDAVQVVLGGFGYLADAATEVSSASPIAEPLSILSSFSVFAVGLSANDYARRRGPWRLLSFALLLVVQSGLGAFSGLKENVALGLVAALLGWGASVRRFPLVPFVVAVLTFVFVVVPFTTSYRSAIIVGNSRLSPLQTLGDIAQQGLGSFLASTPGAGVQSPQSQTVSRISRIGDVAIIVQKTPSDIAYRPVSELLEAPVLGLVPRALWPDKPILATGYVFSQQYYELPAYVYTSSAVTPEGDLWRHGGWPAVIIGMALLGVGVRILDTATADISTHPLRLLLVLSFFVLIVKQEKDVVSLIASVPSLLIGVALATRLVTRRKSDAAELGSASAQWRSSSKGPRQWHQPPVPGRVPMEESSLQSRGRLSRAVASRSDSRRPAPRSSDRSRS